MNRMSRKTKENEKPSFFPFDLDRRQFLKCSALLGGAVAVTPALSQLLDTTRTVFADTGEAYSHYLPEHQIYSVCQQCNTNCGIKVKLVDGFVAKIDGNPYNPWTMTPHIPYNTPITKAAAIEGALCPKGQAGIQSLYDPYRLVKVLKRKGKRGANQWQTISFEQAIKEIAEGGNLFGEGHVEGIKDICTLRDPKVSAALAEDAAQVAAKKMTIADFKEKHEANLHHLINPDHPDLGPKNNQFCLNWGRLKSGRSELLRRFVQNSLGSVNTHGHTTVCQGSLYFGCKAMSDQFTEGKWGGGSKFYWQADTGNAEFILFVGANPYEANYGSPLRAGKMTSGMMDKRMKIAVADPRCSKTASRAWKWLPVRPNGVGALGMGMIRWIIDHERYDARYLVNANKAAAMEDNEPTWTQAAWLVKLRDDGSPGVYLRGSDIGVKPEERAKKDGETWLFDPFIVSVAGKLTPFDPNDEKIAVEGDLLVDAAVKDIKFKSVLQIYREAAAKKSVAAWAKTAGIEEQDIIDLASEFTSHGKRAAVDIHRGVSQQTSGFYNVVLFMLLNVLIGNHDWMGGLAKATTYNIVGDKEGQPFDLGKHTDKMKPWGISIIRHEVVYDKTTLFTGYPSKRVWYPFSSDIYQEIIPSMGDAYPYPIKALLLYMATPVYSLPAGHKLIDILMDPKKIPLIIVSDIVVGETSMYADYIFPDLTYLERWEFSGSHPSVTPKVAPFRQPAVPPLTDAVTVFGEKMPLSMESLILGLAEKLKVTGFGENAFGPGLHLKREEDLYLRMVANIALGDKPDGSEKVPAADAEEMRVFEKSHQHLPETVYELNRWKALVGPELWPHVVYVLNRGGRFQGYSQAYKGDQLANKYGKLVGIYFEKMATIKNSMTGQYYLPYADYLEGPRDCMNNPITDEATGFDMTLITYKTISQTKSRTIGNYWLHALYPENAVEISASDAKKLGLSMGDRVQVVSATNETGVWDLGHGNLKPMIGKVSVKEGIRPGVVAFSLGHGHWAQGASEVVIDGETVPSDHRRTAGIHANAAMRLDPVLKNTGLVDPVGGSAVFYQSQVKLVKLGV
jgi:anaerobic selenocysteine-containing dehydrogenase